jgi:hypothetical protein
VRTICDAVPLEVLRLAPRRARPRVADVRPRCSERLITFLQVLMSSRLSPEHEGCARRCGGSTTRSHRAQPGAGAAGYPWASFEACDSRFIRLPYPEEYGGDGGDLVAYDVGGRGPRACGSSSLFVLIAARVRARPPLRKRG